MSNIITITLIISLQLLLLKLLPGRIAQLVQSRTEKLWFSADSLTMFVQPPGAISGINICACVKNPKHWLPYHGLYTQTLAAIPWFVDTTLAAIPWFVDTTLAAIPWFVDTTLAAIPWFVHTTLAAIPWFVHTTLAAIPWFVHTTLAAIPWFVDTTLAAIPWFVDTTLAAIPWFVDTKNKNTQKEWLLAL